MTSITSNGSGSEMRMKISSTIKGFELDGAEIDVSWRRTTNYAAAVGDANPRYLDDTHPAGQVAPPLFAVSLTWPLVAGLQQQLGGRIPSEALLGMVHSSEHLTFLRPIRPGERLRLHSRVAAVLPARSGARIVLRIEARDSTGAPVFVEHSGATLRGVECDGAAGAGDLPSMAEPKPAEQPLWETIRPISRCAPFVYDGCTDIVFAIHTAVGFARAVGLPDLILQGTATLAMTAAELLDREAGAVPERLKELSCRFTGMVVPGTEIRLRLLSRQAEPGAALLGFEVLNAQGQMALCGAARIAAE